MGRISRIGNHYHSQNDTTKALLSLHTAVFIWGFTGILGKAIDLNAAMLVIYRMLGTSVIYIIYFLIFSIPFRLDRQAIMRMGRVGVIIAVHWVAFYGAIKLANISVAMVCLSTGSIFTLFIEKIWYKKSIDITELLVGLCALLGVVLIYFDNLHFRYGLLAGLIAAFLSGVFTIINKDLVQKYRASVISFYELSVGGILLSFSIPLLFYFLPNMSYIPDWDSILYLFLLCFFCTFLGQILSLNSLKVLSPFTVTLTVNLEILYGIILAFIVYHEQKLMGSHFYMGALLILSSVLIQSYIARQKRKFSN